METTGDMDLYKLLRRLLVQIVVVITCQPTCGGFEYQKPRELNSNSFSSIHNTAFACEHKNIYISSNSVFLI